MITDELVKNFEESKNFQILTFSVLFTITFYLTLILLRKFWSSFKQVEKTVQIQVVSRVVSSIHAVIVTLMGLYQLGFNTKLSQNKLLYSSFSLSLTLNTVLGYLFFDFWMMIFYKEIFDWQFIVHHVVSSAAFFTCSHEGVFPYIAMLRLVSEASTLFVNIRWFLLTFKMKESRMYDINGVMILIVFGLCRIVTIVPIWIVFFDLTQLPLWSTINIFFKIICIFTSIPLDFLNMYWYYRIVIIVWKFLTSKSKNK